MHPCFESEQGEGHESHTPTLSTGWVEEGGSCHLSELDLQCISSSCCEESLGSLSISHLCILQLPISIPVALPSGPHAAEADTQVYSQDWLPE